MSLSGTRLADCVRIATVSMVMGFAVGLAPSALADPLTVIYPKPISEARWNYARSLLELALKRSGRDYVLRSTDATMPQARAIQELEKGRIDLVWAGTSEDYERRLRAIRIPVLRGLEGYRVCITSKARQPTLASIRSIDDFKTISVGQGLGWSDIGILEAAGFSVITSQYDNLFRMVERGRLDCFLRGVHEADDEVAQRTAEMPSLSVEPQLLLVYPFASFFFVNKLNTTLARIIETNLAKAYDDGSFMAVFNSDPVVQRMIAVANASARRRFDIPNPFLTPETNAIPARYWQPGHHNKLAADELPPQP